MPARVLLLLLLVLQSLSAAYMKYTEILNLSNSGSNKVTETEGVEYRICLGMAVSDHFIQYASQP